MKYRMVAPCYFGCEAATAFDVRSIGAEDVQVTDGRVAFTGDEMVLARANLRIRSAERVLVLLKTFVGLSSILVFMSTSITLFSIWWMPRSSMCSSRVLR